MTNCELLKANLLELLFLLKALSTNQRQSLIHFERCEYDLLNQGIPNILEHYNTDEQLQQLICLSQELPEEIRKIKQRNDPTSFPQLSAEQIISFGCLFRLLMLQEMLHNYLSISQLMRMIQIIPSMSPDQQLKLLQQFQQLLGSLEPEVLQSLHGESQSGTCQPDLMESFFCNFSQDQYFLCQPLQALLSADFEDATKIHEVLPKLQPLQLVQLIRLLQLDHLRMLEIRQYLSPDQSGWKGLQSIVDIDEMIDAELAEDESEESDYFEKSFYAEGNSYSTNGLSLTIVDQPPERTVYKRNLRPNPSVMIKGDERNVLQSGESLVIVPVLYRCDTLTPVQKLSDPNPVPASSGSVTKFRRLKILITSHQMNETLFFIRFELRKTDGNKQSDTLAYVQSNPITVVSHSTLMKGSNNLKPSITDVIPSTGSTTGGTRVAILGMNFVDSPAVRVRFDNSEVTPFFHGAGTLICNTPRHVPGQVMVSVSNNGVSWSDKIAFFTYEDVTDDSVPLMQPTDINMGQTEQHHNQFADLSPSQVPTEETFYDWSTFPFDLMTSNVDGVVTFKKFSPLHYEAARGNLHGCVEWLKRGLSPNITDHLGNTPLHWAVLYGHEHLLPLFARVGANINQQNFEGVSVLHNAIEQSVTMVAKLIYLGAWVNTTCMDGISPLHIACATGNTPTIQLLLRCGAFINAADDFGDTCLHYSVRENLKDIVSLLLANNIDANHKNEDSETALHLAISCEHTEISTVLLSNKSVDHSSVNNQGYTPLHLAIEHGLPQVVDQLIHVGANVNENNFFVGSPLKLAMQNKQATIVNMLLSNGAQQNKTQSNFSPANYDCNLPRENMMSTSMDAAFSVYSQMVSVL